MKKLTAILMVFAMLLCMVCTAEESMSLDEQAMNVVSTVNYFVQEYSDMEQLFVQYQEVVEGEIFAFFPEDNSIQALLVGNVEENRLSSCSFICDASEMMDIAMNCASVLPFAQLIIDGADDISDEYYADIEALASWFDSEYEAAEEAFENGESYSASYSGGKFFCVEWQIVPMEEHSRMMVSYYFDPAE